MEHRHLCENNPGVVTVDSILERGSDTGLRDLLIRILHEPWGAWAQAAETAAQRSAVYSPAAADHARAVTAAHRA